jgi:CheY-like chemotaxis protein
MMGGRMGYESRRGEGSTVWFTAPLRKQISVKKVPGMGAVKIEGKPILVVEEHPATRQNLLKQLREWGCLPEEAPGGKKALAMLRDAAKAKTAYPLVILRREMKEIDGITLGREIKKDPRLSSAVLVLLTSQGKRGDGKVAQQIGFTAYLTQPVTGAQLRDCLRLAMARKASRLPLAGPPLITRFSLEEDKKRRVRILLAEDDPGIQKVALQILRNIGYDADVVADGKEVLSALEKTPYDLILMDTEMPRMDGFSTTGAVRGKEKNSGGHIPIVGMTSGPKDGERDRCLETGMDDYILKPIQAIDLADVLDRFFSEGEPERA